MTQTTQDTAFDPAPAAALLAAAWRAGRQLTELPLGLRPRTLDEGYDLQDRLLGELGEEVAGWKLGVGSPLALRTGGLGKPLVGRVLRSHCHPTGATVVLPNACPVTVEFEVAFVLSRDIAPGEAATPLETLVDSAHVTFEFVLSRFVDRRGVGWPSFAGDSVGFEALVIGPEIALSSIGAIVESVVATVDGTEVARGLTGDDLTDPWSALASLIEHAAHRGVTLRQGEIVTTGALARPFNIEGRNAQIVARFLDTEIRACTQVPAGA